MMIKKLNSKKIRLAQILAVYDFEIFHCSNNKNSANDLSRRSDYEKILLLRITLLSTLQNKLMLSLNKKSLTQSKRKNLIELIFVLQLTEVLIKFDTKFAKLMRNRRDILTKLILIFKLIDIYIVISRKVINNVSDSFYEKSKRFIKFLIKELQTRD